MRVLQTARNKTGSAAVVLLITLFIGSFTYDLSAQEVKKEVKTNVKKDLKKDVKKDVKSDVSNDKGKETETGMNEVPGLVRLGISPVVVIPLGSLSGAMGTGFGGQIFCDYKLPFTHKNLVMRGGADAGFIYASAEKLDSTSLYMIPVQGRMTFSYPLSNGLDPYVNLGLGFNYVMLSGSESETSLDPLLGAAIGLSYNHVNMKNFDVFVEAGYMASFETVNGNFFTTKIGVIYRFQSKAANAETK